MHMQTNTRLHMQTHTHPHPSDLQGELGTSALHTGEICGKGTKKLKEG